MSIFLHFVSAAPLIANVFELSDACTLGLAKWITSPLSLNRLTYLKKNNSKSELIQIDISMNLFDAWDIVCRKFFQWTLKFFVIYVSWSMNNFLLSTSCTLWIYLQWITIKHEEKNTHTLPPIFMAFALSANSFNFFWLTWNTGVASLDIVFSIWRTSIILWSLNLK